MEATERLQIGGTLGVYVRGPDEVELRVGTTNGESIVLADGERRGLLARVIEQLVVPRGRELNRQEMAFLEELTPQLREHGLLAGTASPAPCPGFLGRTVDEARVAVVGDGPLGRQLAGHLAVFGFAEVAILKDAGASVPVERLAAFDWVIAAQDCFEPEQLRVIDRERVAARRPWSLVCFDGHEAWVGPTFKPTEGPCFGCFERRLLRGPRDVRNVLGEPGVRLVRLPQPGAGGADAEVRTAFVSSLFALDVARLMAGRSFTLNSLVVMHTITLAMHRETLLRLPRCPSCSSSRGGPAQNVFASILPTGRS